MRFVVQSMAKVRVSIAVPIGRGVGGVAIMAQSLVSGPVPFGHRPGYITVHAGGVVANAVDCVVVDSGKFPRFESLIAILPALIASVTEAMLPFDTAIVDGLLAYRSALLTCVTTNRALRKSLRSVQ